MSGAKLLFTGFLVYVFTLACIQIVVGFGQLLINMIFGGLI